MKIASALYRNAHFGSCDVVYMPDQLDKDKHNFLVLWGGEDVSPSLYKQKVTGAFANEYPSKRDELEVALYKEAVLLGIPIIGVCRGAQLVCAMEGGTLWQHADNHGKNHNIIVDGKVYKTNSCHHQIMRPTDRAVIIGSSPCLSPVKIGENWEESDSNPEPEIVYFPDSKALGVQGHPEWLDYDHDLNLLTYRLLKEIFNYVPNWK